MSKNKTFIIIVVVMLIIAVGLLGLYFFLFSGSPSSVPTQVTTSTDTGSPSRPVTVNQNGGGQTATNTSGAFGTVIPKLREVSTAAVAGGVAFDIATTTYIRYSDKATGHLFQTTATSLSTTLISDTDIPLTRQSLWSKDGSFTYARYAGADGSTLETYYGKIVPLADPAAAATTTQSGTIQYATMQLEGNFLPNNIVSLSLSPTKNSIFYITTTANGAEGVISKQDGTATTQVWSSPFSEWVSQWVTSSTIALTTKPSGLVGGFLYYLNTSSGELSTLLEGIPGLTTLVSPDGKEVLYSSATSNSFATNIYDVGKGTSASFEVNTLPEKCVWSKLNVAMVYCAVPEQILSGIYPDAWYQGLVSFTDDIDEIDLLTGNVIVIAKPSLLGGRAMDITNMSLNTKENNLLFTNKKDGSLWDLNLAQ